MRPLSLYVKDVLRTENDALTRRMKILYAEDQLCYLAVKLITEKYKILKSQEEETQIGDSQMAINAIRQYNKDSQILAVFIPYLEDAVNVASEFVFDIVIADWKFEDGWGVPDSQLQGLLVLLVADQTAKQFGERIILMPNSAFRGEMERSYDLKIITRILEGLVGEEPREWKRGGKATKYGDYKKVFEPVIDECLRKKRKIVLGEEIGYEKRMELAVLIEELIGQIMKLMEDVGGLNGNCEDAQNVLEVNFSKFRELLEAVDTLQVIHLPNKWTFVTLFPKESAFFYSVAGGSIVRFYREWIRGADLTSERVKHIAPAIKEILNRLQAIKGELLSIKSLPYLYYLFRQMNGFRDLVHADCGKLAQKGKELLGEAKGEYLKIKYRLPSGACMKIESFFNEVESAKDIDANVWGGLKSRFKSEFRYDLCGDFYETCSDQFNKSVLTPEVDSAGEKVFEIYSVRDEIENGLQLILQEMSDEKTAIKLEKTENRIYLRMVQGSGVSSLEAIYNMNVVRTGEGVHRALQQLQPYCDVRVETLKNCRKEKYAPYSCLPPEYEDCNSSGEEYFKIEFRFDLPSKEELAWLRI